MGGLGEVLGIRIVVRVFGNTSPFLCRQFNSRRLLGVNYPPARHSGAPVEYTLYLWLIPSDVAMSTHETSQTAVGGVGKANVTACLTALGTDGKPWTVRRKAWSCCLAIG
jgi:hypothetical protein